jgi:hypothetical protein
MACKNVATASELHRQLIADDRRLRAQLDGNPRKRKWVRRVTTDSMHTPPGTFTGFAATIARTMARKEVSPRRLGSKHPNDSVLHQSQWESWFLTTAIRKRSSSHQRLMGISTSLPRSVWAGTCPVACRVADGLRAWPISKKSRIAANVHRGCGGRGRLSPSSCHPTDGIDRIRPRALVGLRLAPVVAHLPKQTNGARERGCKGC